MLLGVVGLIGTGKGAFGDWLVQKHGFQKDAFAAGVKDACAAIFGWDRKMLEGDTTESRAFREEIDPYWTKALGKNFTPRLALQLMGTEAGRNVFHPDLWVHALFRRLKPDTDYIITDVRFPNEIDAIVNHGGQVVQIRRGEFPEWFDTAWRINREAETTPNPHIPTHSLDPKLPHLSEWAWVGNRHLSTWFHNDNTLDDLHHSIDRFIRERKK